MLSHTVSEANVVTAPLIIDTLVDTIVGSIQSAIELLPALILAIIVLALGVGVGWGLKRVVTNLLERTALDDQIEDSLLGSLFEDSDGSLSSGIGTIVQYYVILFAIFLAADIIGFDELGEWLEVLVAYVPSLLAGIIVIVVGIVFSDYAARRTRNSEVAEESGYGLWMEATVRTLLYVVVIVIGLEMIGIDLTIVYMITDGIVSAIGLGITIALALALGVVAGLFGKEYVEAYLEDDGADSSDAE